MTDENRLPGLTVDDKDKLRKALRDAEAAVDQLSDEELDAAEEALEAKMRTLANLPEKAPSSQGLREDVHDDPLWHQIKATTTGGSATPLTSEQETSEQGTSPVATPPVTAARHERSWNRRSWVGLGVAIAAGVVAAIYFPRAGDIPGPIKPDDLAIKGETSGETCTMELRYMDGEEIISPEPEVDKGQLGIPALDWVIFVGKCRQPGFVHIVVSGLVEGWKSFTNLPVEPSHSFAPLTDGTNDIYLNFIAPPAGHVVNVTWYFTTERVENFTNPSPEIENPKKFAEVTAGVVKWWAQEQFLAR